MFATRLPYLRNDDWRTLTGDEIAEKNRVMFCTEKGDVSPAQRRGGETDCRQIASRRSVRCTPDREVPSACASGQAFTTAAFVQDDNKRNERITNSQRRGGAVSGRTPERIA